MNLLRRHIGRRVAGVGVGVALLMLGLEAPAFAASPVISSFTPTTGGPATGGCVVVVTGTALDDFTTAQWQFVSPAAVEVPADPGTADYVLVSDTEAWVTAPALTAGTAYNIKITNAGGTSTSAGTFLATTGAGACAPTITSVTPNCGSKDAKVVIAGTNLLLDPNLGAVGNDIAGGSVQFSTGTSGTYTTVAAVVPPDSDTSTQLTRFVSSGAVDGPIKVTAGGGAAFSTESFQVPPPDCPTALGHTRSITLKLKDKLVAKGTVKSTETTPFTDCAASVPVKIQRKVSGSWKTVGKTTTSDTGAYSKKIKNKKGKYRSIAVKTTLTGGEVCLKAKSPVRTH
jgi:IPT/TIG domain